MKEKLTILISTGFYSGLSPKAPGTCGSILAFVLIYLASLVSKELVSPANIIVLSVGLTLIGIYVSNLALELGLFSKSKDPKQIVIDEWAGYATACIAIEPTLTQLLIALVLFRIFDIFKPPPVSTVEKLPRGYGIVLDDVVAGVYALVCLRLTNFALGSL